MEAEKKQFEKNQDKKDKKKIIKEDPNLPSQLKTQNPRKRHVSGDSMVTINSNMSGSFATGKEKIKLLNKFRFPRKIYS